MNDDVDLLKAKIVAAKAQPCYNEAMGGGAAYALEYDLF